MTTVSVVEGCQTVLVVFCFNCYQVTCRDPSLNLVLTQHTHHPPNVCISLQRGKLVQVTILLAENAALLVKSLTFRSGRFSNIAWRRERFVFRSFLGSKQFVVGKLLTQRFMPRRHNVHHEINSHILFERQPMWQLSNGSKIGHRSTESGLGFFALILHHWILGRTFGIFLLAQCLINDAFFPPDVRALCVRTLKRQDAISDRFSYAICSVLNLVCLFAITCEIWSTESVLFCEANKRSRSAQSGRKCLANKEGNNSPEPNEPACSQIVQWGLLHSSSFCLDFHEIFWKAWTDHYEISSCSV